MRLSIRLFSSVVQKRPFYITTPIFYVNAAPHLGHLYTAVVADAIQRFEKLTNPDCNIIFSTGTDEHGTKIQQAAAQAKLPLQDYCNNISQEYKELFNEFEIGYTDFIRTTEERHKKAVRHFWRKLVQKDYIYKAKYAGWYSVNDEAFVPESHTKDEITKDGKVKVSTESGHKLEWTEETNYMFRLSEFKTHLKEWLKPDSFGINHVIMSVWNGAKNTGRISPLNRNSDSLSKKCTSPHVTSGGYETWDGVIQPSKFQKQLQEFLASDAYFPDISVSRPSSRVHWAVRVPDDEEQSIYVWLDALINYLTVCGYPDDEQLMARRAWPADVHVVGKDILKFHGIYWPAFLMAARWQPPRQLVCHSHWTVDGQKMSKSLGNVVAPHSVLAPAALRYVLLREATMADDANYSETKLLNIANSELADTLGNLVSRACGAALNPRHELPPPHAHELRSVARRDPAARLMRALDRLPETCHQHFSNYQFYKGVDAVIHVLHLANLFFETMKPWELKKNPECQKELDVVLHITLETLRICSIILQPIIPGLSSKLLDKLQVPKECRYWKHCEKPSWRIKGAIFETKNIQSGKFVLFQRIYVDKKNVHKKKASV